MVVVLWLDSGSWDESGGGIEGKGGILDNDHIRSRSIPLRTRGTTQTQTTMRAMSHHSIRTFEYSSVLYDSKGSGGALENGSGEWKQCSGVVLRLEGGRMGGYQV